MAAGIAKPSGNSGQSTADQLFEDILLMLAKLAGLLGSWTVRFPVLSLPIIIVAWASAWLGWGGGLVVAGVYALIYIVWTLVDPAGFRAASWLPVRTAYLTWWRYKHAWAQVCTLHGLTATLGERTLVPRLRSVRIGTATDTLNIGMVTGQTATDWGKKADALAHAWGSGRVTVRSPQPGQLTVTVHRDDTLAAAVRLPRPTTAARVQLAAATVGVTDTGTPWRLPIQGHHILVAGSTGSGKSSVVQSLVAGLAPAVRSGLVQLCVIDPKGGMEFARGAGLFTVFAADRAEQTLVLLRGLVKLMDGRTQLLRGHTRTHTPSVEDPLTVVIIDELAALTAYGTDRKIRAEVDQLLGLLLSQGRAVGITLIGAVQDPSKEVVSLRQHFTVRVGLRLTESNQTTMILGQAARDAGAVCDEIPDSTPGVGYVMVDGTAEPQRVRAFHVTDDDIDYLVTHFQPPKRRRPPRRPDTASSQG